MADEERRDLPAEPAPDEGGDVRPLHDGSGAVGRPEDRLGKEIGETADSVTRQLRDLQDELMPAAEPVRPAQVEPPAVETVVEGPPAEPSAPLPAGAALPAGALSAPRYQAKSGGRPLPEGTDDDRLLSMLAWLSMAILQFPVVSLIQLVSENTKNRPFQRHHAITSLLYYGAAVVYEFVAIGVLFTFFTPLLVCLCLWPVLFLPQALALYYAFQAYSGKRIEVPYLSGFGRRQGWL